MPVATNGAIRLHYESFGSRRDPALLLINGWGSQLLSFPEPSATGWSRAGCG